MKDFVESVRRLYTLYSTTTVLGWSVMARVAAIAPALALLWLAVWWASLEAAPL